MTMNAAPVVGSWYRRLDRPQPFQVVAFDRAEDSVDVEYFDGTLDEWPISHWHELPIEICEAPQDWRGPFDAADGAGSDDQSTELASPGQEAEAASPVEGSDMLVVPSRSHVPGAGPSRHAHAKKAKAGARSPRR